MFSCDISMRMKTAITLSIMLALVAMPVAAQKVYKWVDKDGNVHFGDSVPPEYADQVFKSDDEKASASASPSAASVAVTEEITRRREAAEQQQADRILLQTYLSVEEIEAVRDDRIDQLKSQDRLTERYMATLQRRLAELEAKPVAEGEEADHAAEIADTKDQIRVYQEELVRSRTEQDQIREKFAQDISRFKELTDSQPGS